MSTRALTATLPEDLATKLDEMADALGLSTEMIVEQAIEAWVDRDEHLHRLTLAALEDVDRGRVVDHATVARWADELCDRAPARPN